MTSFVFVSPNQSRVLAEMKAWANGERTDVKRVCFSEDEALSAFNALRDAHKNSGKLYVRACIALKNNQPFFKGRVLLAPGYSIAMRDEQAKGNNKLVDAKDAFKVYWQTGFHGDLGQDSPFLRPEEIREMGLRKTHIRQTFYPSDRGYTATKKAWDKWSSGNVSIKPSSNSYLIYTVTENRDAIVSWFFPDNAHKLCDLERVMEEIISSTHELFKKFSLVPMPLAEQAHIFDNRWLDMPTNDD